MLVDLWAPLRLHIDSNFVLIYLKTFRNHLRCFQDDLQCLKMIFLAFYEDYHQRLQNGYPNDELLRIQIFVILNLKNWIFAIFLFSLLWRIGTPVLRLQSKKKWDLKALGGVFEASKHIGTIFLSKTWNFWDFLWKLHILHLSTSLVGYTGVCEVCL